MNTIKIGIIDDSNSKRSEIKSALLRKIDHLSQDKIDLHNENTFEIDYVEFLPNINEMVKSIYVSDIECLVVDYNLSSRRSLDYSGVDIAKSLKGYRYGFPIFMLTSFEDSLFSKEDFNTYQVFNWERVAKDDQELSEFTTKIIHQVLIYRKKIENYKSELLELQSKERNSNEDSRLLELNQLLECELDGVHSKSNMINLSAFYDEKFENVMKKVDELLHELED